MAESRPEQAFVRACALAGEQGVVVITGSLRLAGGLRPFIRSCQAQLSGLRVGVRRGAA